MKNTTVKEAGRKGGQNGTGKAKARTTEQARAAAKARWDKYREKKSQYIVLDSLYLSDASK